MPPKRLVEVVLPDWGGGGERSDRALGMLRLLSDEYLTPFSRRCRPHQHQG